MNKTGHSILRGVREVKAYAPGDVTKLRITAVRPPVPVDVKALRLQLGLSHEAFAVRYGFNVATLRDWEQGRYRPMGSARVLLTVIVHEHEAVERALAAHESLPHVAVDSRFATPRLPAK